MICLACHHTLRINDGVTVSTRRQVLRPWALSDGTKLDIGDWLVTPARSIMRDPIHYPDPLHFEGFRFVDQATIDQATSAENFKALQSKPSSLTDTGDDWQMWGTGRMTWLVQNPAIQ